MPSMNEIQSARLQEALAHQDWFNAAKCVGLYPSNYMIPDSPKSQGRPPKNGLKKPNIDDIENAVAQAVCKGKDGLGVCPVIGECLKYARLTNSDYGVWGAMGSKARLAYFRKVKVNEM